MKTIPVRKITDKKETLTSEKFSIRDVKDLLGGKDLKHELHRHDYFFILALKKGSGIHEIDFKKYKIVDNSVFFLRPGQVHEIEFKAGSTGYLMEFNTEFYRPSNSQSNQRLQKASNIKIYKFDGKRFNKIDTLLGDILKEFTFKQEGYQEAIKSNLEILFIELVRQSGNQRNEIKTSDEYAQVRLQEFLELLEKNITTLKQSSDYAGLLNLSLYQLNGITKSTVGKTSSDLINEFIILEAKRFLLATPNQVKDIAYHLGYEDASYFIRFFKKHTGFAPEVFRQNFK